MSIQEVLISDANEMTQKSVQSYVFGPEDWGGDGASEDLCTAYRRITRVRKIEVADSDKLEMRKFLKAIDEGF